jgi:hypothetical protein
LLYDFKFFTGNPSIRQVLFLLLFGVLMQTGGPVQAQTVARAELLGSADGDEILPIEYDDNYVTVFPGETVQIRGRVPAGGPDPTWVRVTGYNGAPVVVPVR